MKTKRMLYFAALPIMLGVILACNIGLTTTQPTPTPPATSAFTIVTVDPNAPPTPTPFQPNTPVPSQYLEAIGEIVITETSAVLNMTFFPSALTGDKSHDEEITWAFLVNGLVRCTGQGSEGSQQCVWDTEEKVDANSIELFIDLQKVTFDTVEEGRFYFEVTVVR